MKLRKLRQIFKSILISIFLLCTIISFQNCAEGKFNLDKLTEGSPSVSTTLNDTPSNPIPVEPPPVDKSEISLEQRMAAATETANSSAKCVSIQPFYWEIGDKNKLLASGATGDGSIGNDTKMPIASASKLFFGAYVAEVRNGILSENDLKFLTMKSGYTNFKICPSSAGATIKSCLESGTNGDYSAENDGQYYYGGGHFQKWAFDNGLANMNRAQLDDEYATKLGLKGITFNSPQPAGGMEGDAQSASLFLRRILNKELKLSALLGFKPVCTEPSTCSEAKNSPFSPESNHYSIGHWVEDDPNTNGDGAFSSPGAFGFYPWIDSSKTFYGVLARSDTSGGGAKGSVYCGRLIRRAFTDGVVY